MSSRQTAEDFVRDQLRIMREHGGAPKLSAEERHDLVVSVQRSLEALKPAPKPQKRQLAAASR